jgi:PKHD-type hydroxylase
MIHVLKEKASLSFCKKHIYFYKYAKWLRQKSQVTSAYENDKNVFADVRKSEYIRFFPDYFQDEVYEIYDYIYKQAKKLFDYDFWSIEYQKEDIKIIKYKNNDFFDWHYDCFHDMSKTRKVNFTIQLNENYEGGDLEFFKINCPKNKEMGTVILYSSFLPHRINPITKGIRYSMVGHLNGPEFR